MRALGGSGVRRQYSEKFKQRMLERLTGPKAISASQLSKENNVGQSTLSKWLTKSKAITVRTNVSVKKDEPSEDRRPQDWSVEEKLELVLEAAAIPEAELGAFLRGKGIHEADLTGWRSAVMEGARTNLADDQRKRDGKPRAAESKQIKALMKQVEALEKELNRKEKALAEAAALLILKKKLQALHLDEDDDDPGRNEK
jgi:transposase